jgi:transposase-like protein
MFGPQIAANLRRRRSPPTGRWNLDEMVVKIGGRVGAGRRKMRFFCYSH